MLADARNSSIVKSMSRIDLETCPGFHRAGLDILHVSPLKALFYTAVINGVLAPFLLVGILVAASDRKLMQSQPSSWLSRIIVGLAALAMFAAAIAMFVW